MNPLSGISELAWAPVFYRDVSPNGDRRKVLPPQICAYVYSGGDQRCKVCGVEELRMKNDARIFYCLLT